VGNDSIAVGIVPFTDERGLRDYRSQIAASVPPWSPWGWWLLVAFVVGLVLGIQLQGIL
jgi:hypothetical protein